MKPEDRSCLTKRRFPTEVDALLAAGAYIARKAKRGKPFWRLYAYHCKYCGQWHITKRGQA